MNTYDVYIHTDKGYQAIKDGFSYPAFFFTVIWAFVKKLWVVGVILFLISAIIIYVEGIFASFNPAFAGSLNIVTTLIFSLIVGSNGNSWRRTNLEKQNWGKHATVEAKSPEGAIMSVIVSNR